jgi:hypothetical protein
MPCAYVMYGKLSRAERKTPPTARLGCRRLAVATATARLWCTPSASPACVAATCESPAARCSGAAVQRSRRRRLSPRTSTCRVRRCMRCSRCQNVRGGGLQRTIRLEGTWALRGELCRVTAAGWGNGDDRLRRRGVCVGQHRPPWNLFVGSVHTTIVVLSIAGAVARRRMQRQTPSRGREAAHVRE